MWVDSNNGYVNLNHVRVIEHRTLGNGNLVLILVTDTGEYFLPAEYATLSDAQDAAMTMLNATVRIS